MNRSRLLQDLKPFFLRWLTQAEEGGVIGGGPQEGPGIDVVGRAVGLGGDLPLVYHTDGRPVSEYATAAEACAAATAGEKVQLQAGVYLESPTVPAGVTLMGRGKATVISGTVTLGDGAALVDCTLRQDVDQAGDAVCLVPPSGDGEMAYVIGCDVIANNATGAGYAAYGACDHLEFRHCGEISAQSAGVDANPFGAPVAATTYYFDASVAGPSDPDDCWDYDALAFDGLTSPFQYACRIGNEWGSPTEYYLGATGTTAPGSGATISGARVRVYAYTTFAPLGLGFVVYSGAELLLDATWSVPGERSWSDYYDLAAPTGGWSWPVLQALEVRVFEENSSNINVMQVYRVDLEVATGGATSANPYVLGCGIPNAEGRAAAIPLYGDRASWRTDVAGGATHADDWEDGASHHRGVTISAEAADVLALMDQEIDLEAQAANTVLAGPASGADAKPTFRSLVAADLGTGTPDGTKFLRDDLTWQFAATSGGGGSGTPAGYAETIGDGVETEYTVTHSLDTLDVIVQVYDLDAVPVVKVDPIIDIIDADTVQVTFLDVPDEDQYRVLVLAVGVVSPADFVDLNDTPASYVGQGGKYVAVKATEDGLEFL